MNRHNNNQGNNLKTIKYIDEYEFIKKIVLSKSMAIRNTTFFIE